MTMPHRADFFKSLSSGAAACPIPLISGPVTAVSELHLCARLPGARIGSLVRTGSLLCRVSRMNGPDVTLVPFGDTASVCVQQMAHIVATCASIPCGESLLGRVIDALGIPLDRAPSPAHTRIWPLTRPAPDPLCRTPIDTPFITGIRAIDSMTTLGRGQKIGLFAGPGLGKTTVLGQLIRTADSDVNVLCMVGERGREAGEFIHKTLGEEGMSRTVIVLATADAPASMRLQALETAIAVSEWFRESGNHVLLLVDSITRAARASRDLAAAISQNDHLNYTVSALSVLPGLLERLGNSEQGSITAVLSVLTQDGRDPLEQELKSLLDGHLHLSAALARRGIWPAMNPVTSISRVMHHLATETHFRAAAVVRRVIASFQDNEELVLMGAYRKGASPDTDAWLANRQQIEAFFSQSNLEPAPFDKTIAELIHLAHVLSPH